MEASILGGLHILCGDCIVSDMWGILHYIVCVSMGEAEVRRMAGMSYVVCSAVYNSYSTSEGVLNKFLV